jgi:hypothetical protein
VASSTSKIGKSFGNLVATTFESPVFIAAGQIVVRVIKVFLRVKSSSPSDNMKPIIPALEALDKKCLIKMIYNFNNDSLTEMN